MTEKNRSKNPEQFSIIEQENYRPFKINDRVRIMRLPGPHANANGEKYEGRSCVITDLKPIVAFQLNEKVEISLSVIESISVNDKNTGRTIANIALTTVGTIFVAALLYAALKSSCPFVYIKNGKEYDFVGELYPGTITANMQEDDYLSLPNNLVENNEYVFAKVKGSSSWSTDYNAYNGRLILDFLYHDEEKQLKFSERSVNTSELIKIKKEDIPYYKNQENGTSIKTIITEGDQGLEDNQENVF